MSLNPDLKKIIEQLEKQTDELIEIKISVARHEEILSSHVKHDEILDATIKSELKEYNQLLKEHIAGVMELRTQNALIRQEIEQRDQLLEATLKETNIRLEVAERPIKWFQGTYLIMKWLGALGTAIGLGYALIQWLK